MIWGLDTNVVVRFFVRDDEKQAQLVYALFKKIEKSREKAYLPLLVILETIWVLESAYRYERNEILNALKDLREMTFMEYESDETVVKFIEEAEISAYDLSDLLIAHAAKSNGCHKVFTFDKKASRHNLFELVK